MLESKWHVGDMLPRRSRKSIVSGALAVSCRLVWPRYQGGGLGIWEILSGGASDFGKSRLHDRGGGGDFFWRGTGGSGRARPVLWGVVVDPWRQYGASIMFMCLFLLHFGAEIIACDGNNLAEKCTGSDRVPGI